MSGAKITIHEPAQSSTKLSIDPLVLESAKITLANTGLDLGTYIEASLRKLVQDNSLPFEVVSNPVVWAEEESVRNSVGYVTSGIYFEAESVWDEVMQAVVESPDSLLLSMLIGNFNGLQMQMRRLYESLQLVAGIFMDQDMRRAISYGLSVIESKVSRFLADHALEANSISRNEPSLDLTVKASLDLFDSYYAGVLDCYERNPDRFAAYLNYYNQLPLLEALRSDLSERNKGATKTEGAKF